jgi:hypothetical protein
VSTTPPRGIRNHNPLNIRATGIQWEGLSAQASEVDFCVFVDPKYGIRAAAKILQTYAERHGINTLAGVIERWAPPHENDTAAYVMAVSIWADLEADAVIDLHDYDTVLALLRAMARMENGKPPQDLDPAWYPPSVWEQGLRLAGLAPSKPLTNSRTMRGVAAAGASTATAFAMLADWLNLPPELAELLPVVFASVSQEMLAAVLLLVGLVGNLYAAHARRDDQQNGRL